MLNARWKVNLIVFGTKKNGRAVVSHIARALPEGDPLIFFLTKIATKKEGPFFLPLSNSFSLLFLVHSLCFILSVLHHHPSQRCNAAKEGPCNIHSHNKGHSLHAQSVNRF